MEAKLSDNRNVYSVYKHTAPNGKVYIGITSQNPEARWGKDGNGYNTGHFRNAIKKYGWNSIEHKILATGLSEDDACIAEKKLIKHYDSRNPAKGYNQQAGGQVGWAGMHHTPEARAKLSRGKRGELNPMYGTHLSAEHRQKISRALSGRKCSEETKARMREVQSHRTEETIRRLCEAQAKKAVLCIDTGRIFDSVSSAARELGSSPSNVTACCKGRRRVVKGFRLCFYES